MNGSADAMLQHEKSTRPVMTSVSASFVLDPAGSIVSIPPQ
jgi:hypothetical protein